MNSFDINVKGLWENLRLRNRGTTYFVDGFNGDDTRDGFTPANAFQSIRHALDQCVSANDDYIFCWNLWRQDTFPIEVDRNAVHIIGIHGPQGYPGMSVPTDTATFHFAAGAGDNSEIACFALGGTGAAVHASIEMDGDNNSVWIHNCSFGHLWCGEPVVAIQDGIRMTGPAVFHNGVIEDCWFHGSAVGAGRIARCGIWGEWLSLVTIRNNYFLKCPGYDILGDGDMVGGAIYLAAGNQCSIIHNKIGVADDTKSGNGIYLKECQGCLIAENEANRGVVTDAKIPFVDMAGGDFNDWMCNQVGKANQDPATSVA